MSSPLSGDGYFATWACFLASCAFVHQEVAFYRGQFDALKESFVGRGARLRGLLFIASVVCVWESALVCSDIPSALCNGDENAANRLGRLGLPRRGRRAGRPARPPSHRPCRVRGWKA